MNYIKFFIVFVSLLFLSNAYSQELFPVQNFVPDTYRGETQNWDICQAENNVIYIANNKGMLEFNGANWKLYQSPNQTTMRSVNILGDKIYTGCFLEFGYWERDDFSNLKYVSLSEKIKDELLHDEDFWKIVFYQHYVLFQSLRRIYIYDSRNEQFQIITSENYLPKLFKVGGQIYFQKFNEGIFQFEDGKPLLISDFHIFKNNIVINIFHLGNKLLIQTQEKGFFVLDNGNVSKWKMEAASKINSFSVYSSWQLQDGSFVLGTIGEGVYFLSPDGKITSHLDKKNGLQNNTVLSIFEDADHNIWLGLDNGISVLNYTSPFHVFYDAEGIFGTVYASACHQGYLYLGTNQGLFYRALSRNDKFKLINGTKGQVWMMKVIDNTLFCGHNSGTFIVSGDKVDLICSELGTWDIKQIEGNPNLLLQGNYEGLSLLEKFNGNWRHRNKIEGFNISSRYFEIMDDNQIFVNHEYKGVYRLDVSKDYKNVIKFDKIPSAPLGPNSGIVKHNDKLLYFTETGIYEYDKNSQFTKNEKLTNLTFDDDAYISGKMIKDAERTLWIFTKNNITAILPGKFNTEPNIHRVALPLSLRENVVGYENLLHLGNNIYLLGTTNGYLLFNLSKIIDKKCTVQINSIENNSSNQRFKSKENNIKISYSVPVFFKFVPVKYQYKLEGAYGEWSDWTNESEIEFKNLPPGSYTFHIRAKVGNMLTSNTASYRFSIAEYWYASWWMILVYAILFGVVLLLTNRWYRIRYEKKAEKINQEKLLLQLKNEKETIKLKNENLNSEVESVNRELASSTLAVVKKNELLNTIRLKLQQGTTSAANVDSALKIIDENLDKNSDWETFREVFNNTDRDFMKKLKELHPALTPNDLKLCVYLRLNLSSKEIATLLYISPQSVEVKRFRLRKKLDLNHGENLTEYILGV